MFCELEVYDTNDLRLRQQDASQGVLGDLIARGCNRRRSKVSLSQLLEWLTS